MYQLAYLCRLILLNMWLILAFFSAAMLGFYDASKKASLKDNAVLPVLLLNTIFSTVIFSPFLMDYLGGFGWFNGTFLDTSPFQGKAQTPAGQQIIETACSLPTARSAHNFLGINPLGSSASIIKAHLMVVLKAFIVLSSWIFGYFGMKHLPITIVGPINATRPVLTLLGAMLIFGEDLNAWQWGGVLLALFSLFLLSRAGKSEGVDFRHNIWVLSVAAAAVVGACCGLYDRHIMHSLEPMFVQSWYVLYQAVLMGITISLLTIFKTKKQGGTDSFHWSWAIPLISLFLSAADVAYLFALSDPDAMISVVSMIRRGSVIVSFLFGVIALHEKNVKMKIIDLSILLIGLVLLVLGSR